MEASNDLTQLERRVSRLEKSCNNGPDREEIRQLWESIREERDVETLFRRLREATKDRKPPQRAVVHGMIDTLLANGGGVEPATPTILVTSSEPCALVIFTAITATICD